MATVAVEGHVEHVLDFLREREYSDDKDDLKSSLHRVLAITSITSSRLSTGSSGDADILAAMITSAMPVAVQAMPETKRRASNCQQLLLTTPVRNLIFVPPSS